MPPTICSLPLSTIARICSYLNSPPDPRVAGKDLATLCAVARTCRRLSEPALDALWRVLPSLLPLLATLPEDVYAAEEVAYSEEELGSFAYMGFSTMGERAPRREEFARFRLYAPRVRVIDPYQHWPILAALPSALRAHLSPRVWRMLEMFGPRPLLPNLVYAILPEIPLVAASKPYNLPASRPAALFGPSLKKVRLCMYDHGPSIGRTVTTLAHGSPALEHLALEYKGRFYQQLDVQVCFLRALVSLELYQIVVSPIALLYLGTLPSLQLLRFAAYNEDHPLNAFPPTIDRRPSSFLALRQAILATDSLECCVAFVRTISSSQLESFTAHCLARPAPRPLMYALCTALSELPAPPRAPPLFRTLEIISGYARRPDAAPSNWDVYLASTLAPLLRLPALTSLSITGRCLTALDDAALAAMAAAWPRIAVLDLPFYRVGPPCLYPWPPRPLASLPAPDPPEVAGSWDAPCALQATLAGLIPLAAGCPELALLALGVDMRAVPEMDLAGGASACSPVPTSRRARSMRWTGRRRRRRCRWGRRR